MTASVYIALERALDSCEVLGDENLTLEQWADWVRSTDTLDETQKDVVLNATADEYREYADHAHAAAQSRLDQSDARVAGVDYALAALAPYRIEGDETIGELVDRLHEDDKAEAGKVRALLGSVFPDGTVTIVVTP